MNLPLPWDEALAWYAPFHLVVLFFVARPFWQTYRELAKTPGLRFHLIEMVAAAVSVAPTLALFAEGVKRLQGAQRGGEAYTWLILAVLIGLSQLAGLLIGRVHNLAPSENGPRSEWEQAGWIFGWTLVATLLLPAGMAAAALLLFVFTFGWPALLPLAFVLIVLRMLRQGPF